MGRKKGKFTMASAVLEFQTEASDRFRHVSSFQEWQNEGESSLASDVRALGYLSPIENATIIIEPRTLMREFLERSLSSLGLESRIASFPDVANWIRLKDWEEWPSPLILLNSCSENSSRANNELHDLRTHDANTPVVIFSDDESRSAVTRAIDTGARGYIPTSFPMHSIKHILKFVRAGGVFVPASCLQSASPVTETSPVTAVNALFTGRQAAVVAALKRGKQNKTIAYELNMCESTVKVHVRAIMKKMKARNRTEVAVRLSETRADTRS
jgi:DNA-binding NarL/FixJ family response regulator